MDEKVKILLDKINIDEDNYQYFLDATMTKIKLNKKRDRWIIYIDKDEDTEVGEEDFIKIMQKTNMF